MCIYNIYIYIYIHQYSTRVLILLFAKICLHNKPALALALAFGENLSKFRQPVKMVKSHQSEYNSVKVIKTQREFKGNCMDLKKTTDQNSDPPRISQELWPISSMYGKFTYI